MKTRLIANVDGALSHDIVNYVYKLTLILILRGSRLFLETN